jgi:integrase
MSKGTSTRVRLTERSAAAARPLVAGGEPRAKLYLDTQRVGFGLAVSATGAKSFFVNRRVNGKQVRSVFGRFGELTVAQARDDAEQLLAQMGRGVNPVEEKRKARVEAKRQEVRGITLRSALDLYERALRAKGRAARTIEDYRYLIEKYLAGWLDRSLGEITRKEARERHQAIPAEIARGKHGRKRGKGSGTLTANHAMRAFRAVYNRALKEHPELPICPTINVDWNKENRRTTRIAAADMKGWHGQVQALENGVRRDYLLFTLFSGLRHENAAEVRWEDVDWQHRALRVPRPKSQRPFDLPLSDYLVSLLRRRQKENAVLAPDSPWVFPAARGEGHIVEVRMEGGEARAKRAKAGDAAEKRYTPHDLRRTFISVAESLGISREARQLLVNHSTPKSDVHGGYVVPELEELRAHMQRIAARLSALCKGEAAAVLPMRKRGAKEAR